MAPATGFGAFSGDLLIGNFGDGEISAYEPQSPGTYELVGQLRGSDHNVLSIDGLWALQFGKGSANNGRDDHADLHGRPGRRDARAVRSDHGRLTQRVHPAGNAADGPASTELARVSSRSPGIATPRAARWAMAKSGSVGVLRLERSIRASSRRSRASRLHLHEIVGAVVVEPR